MQPRQTGAAAVLGAAALLSWASCGTGDREQPDTGPTPPPPETHEAEATDPAPEEPFVEHQVAEGQTLWDIARAYEVEVNDVMEANGMRPRDVRRLRQGRVLRIPGAQQVIEVETAAARAARQEQERESLPELDDAAYHFLASGETVWDLARTYDKSVDEIMERNGFTDDDVRGFRPGRPIVIPGIRPSQVQAAAPQQRQGITHEVARGETVWDLANAFQVSVSELMAANGLSPDQVTQLREGARLFIPGVSEDRGGRVVRRSTGRQRRATGLAQRIGLGTRSAASNLLRGRVPREWIRAAGRGRRMPGTLRWPVTNGWFVRGYGSGEEGYHLAVDIAGEIGWNVRAAAPGIVGYSGNEVRGYGNMVLVVHPGGWVTMYAHNSANFVVAGERVPRGGILAEVGSTGISRGPHVHFEFIHAGTNCDPAVLFRPGIRHRNGRLTPLPQAIWRNAASRPDRVRCAPRRRHPRSRWVVNE